MDLIHTAQRKIWLKILAIRDHQLRLRGDTSQSLEASKLYPTLENHPVPYVVEIGANDGYNLSNSLFFINQGWQALLIEPVPTSLQKAKLLHSGNDRVRFEQCAISSSRGKKKLFLDKTGNANLFATIEEGENPIKNKFVDPTRFELVQTKTLESVLKNHKVPKAFALLSIDVEGHESNVIEKLGDFRPSVILIERSLHDVVEPLRKQTILTSLKYINAARIGCNEIYIDSQSFFIKKRIQEFSKLSSIGI